MSNESGATDPYDFQYVLFNLIAMVAVLVIFIDRPGAGAPEIPTFLAVLTGGSAATYATRKALAKNPPVITSMVPTTAKVGDEILVRGENLFLSTPPPPPPPPGVVPDPPDETRVTVGGVAATVVKAQADRVTFIVPAVATGQHEVRLTTNLGATAEKVEQLTVVS